MPTPTPPVIPDSKDAEAAFARAKARIDAVPEAGLDPLNVDLDKAGKAGYALAQKCVSPEVWERLALFPPVLFDAPVRVIELVDLSLAASWVATQGLTVRAAQTEAQLPQALVQDALAVKARMQATCTYCLDDAESVRELASIQSGTGYDDLKHDLRRLAVLYRDHEADLSGKKYDAADEAKALALADEINLRQRGPTASEQAKLERRVWKLLRGAAERAYDAARFVTDVLPLVQKSIPSIHAWRERTRSNPGDNGGGTATGGTPGEPSTPVTPPTA